MQNVHVTVAPKLQRECTISSLSTHGSSGGSATGEYPAGLVVRNTFLDFNIDRPASLEGFMAERLVQSAPGSRLEDVNSEVPSVNEGLVASPASFKQQDGDAELKIAEGPSTLQLAELLAGPQLGSAELPTIGSKNHHLRRCKPCAFLFKEPGCDNGIDCPFCHLCVAGEKKRRAKEKRARVRSLRAGAGGVRRALADGLSRLIS